MDVTVAGTAWDQVVADWLVVGVFEETELSGRTAALNQKLDGSLSALLQADDFKGKPGETITLYRPAGLKASRLLLVGLGKAAELTLGRVESAFRTAARTASGKKQQRIAFALPDLAGTPVSSEAAAQAAATAGVVGCVGQDLHRTEAGRHAFSAVEVLVDSSTDSAHMNRAVEKGRVLGAAVNLTRELVNRPASEIYPETFAERAREVAEAHQLKCEILDEVRLKAERMGSLLAVAQGSDRPPRVVVLEYSGGGAGKPTLALVGKGVTFDSGGLSIKPNDSMLTMKCDMAGAATVLGAISAIATLKLPVNVVAYMGLVENMVSGSSYKLGDVLTARNGVTIEVLNTDAEGRLVLADVLSYAADHGADRLIDLATLTGACVVALGEDVTGVFSNDQNWCDDVLTAAKTVGEEAWQLPTFDFYGELLKSDVADVKNVGGRWGGAITAAKFLEKFVAGKPWVHLDIAGPSFASSNKPHREGGATGCMVRTLVATAERLADG